MTQKLITEKEAAPILNVALSTLRKWRINKTGPSYYKIGNKVLYDVGELAEFIRDSKIETTDHG